MMGAWPTRAYVADDSTGYSVVTTNTPAGTERRFYRGGHHFLSLVDNGGTFNLRPHPGVDRNGWGGSLYLQPFIAGAVLRGASVNLVTVGSNGVAVGASGVVCQGDSGSYGAWQTLLGIQYDLTTKHVVAVGTNWITLSGQISGAGGDLNLYRLANNYLDDVPLLSGATGDTGDMTNAVAVGHNFVKEWVPPMGGFFPQDWTYSLTVTAFGNYNQVDTAAQGLCPIQAAYKPTIQVGMATTNLGIAMIFGAYFAQDKAQDFTADNVGITPLVLPATTATQFMFTVRIEAGAVAGDGMGIGADFRARFPDDPDHAEVFYAPDLRVPFRRLVGILPRVSPGEYAGEVIVPYPPEGGPDPERGFFIARPPCQPSASAAKVQTASAPTVKGAKAAGKKRKAAR